MSPRTGATLMGQSVVIAAVLLACSLSPASSPSPSSIPAATTRPFATASPTPPAPEHFEFVRWLSRDVEFFSAPGGGELVGSSNDYETAAVVDRTTVDGIEWIRVQTGFAAPGHFVTHGWAPEHVAGIGRTYEPFVPTCPDKQPTVVDISGMPLQALSCFGSQTLTFSPVQVRNEGSDLSEIVDGSPAWLAEGDGLIAHWLPEWQEVGGVPIYVDPASQIRVPEHTWLEISGHLDHAAAQGCSMASNLAEVVHVSTPQEAILLCRGRFVVTAVRQLPDAEIPARSDDVSPGPTPLFSLLATVKEFPAPMRTRLASAAVWTGSEMIVWGGWEWRDDGGIAARTGGAAYSPAIGEWRDIATGPLAARGGAAAAWTGTEMLVWGGYRGNRPGSSDGAAYDPATDTWRSIAQAPIQGARWTASVWTGTEWWVAVTRNDRVAVAAYGPATDSWRRIDSPELDARDGTELIWTGSDIYLMNSNGGPFRMAPFDAEWAVQPLAFHGPFAWTGGLLVGSRTANIARNPLDWDPFNYPVGWDPVSREEVALALPPYKTYDRPVWTGRYLLFAEDGLALDVVADEWLTLDLDQEPPKFGYRSDAAMVWAGDRIIVWGGWSACFGYAPGYEIGYELIPVPRNSGQAGALALTMGAREGSPPEASARQAPPNRTPDSTRAC